MSYISAILYGPKLVLSGCIDMTFFVLMLILDYIYPEENKE